MPANRNALVRYKTIDACLRNRQRKWTLDDLVEKVSDTLYEYEGIDKGISIRTIQADIQMMRSDKLGYFAPIIVIDKKYYTYEDPKYSITNIPISNADLGRMNEAVELLKQFKGFSHFNQLNEIVQKLEDHVYAAAHKKQSVINFEKNENLKGLSYLDLLYHSIVQKKAVELTYQSFKAQEANTFIFHVWWLKEFKNRWFAVGVRGVKKIIMHLALDRIQYLCPDEKTDYIENDLYDSETFYQDVIGVTVSTGLKAEEITLFVANEDAPFVETKPLHHSQKILNKNKDGITVQIKVQINFELEREILGFGDRMQIISPAAFKKRIHDRLHRSVKNYETKNFIQS
ncbi:YafY family protein [Emticicia sp. BO119]|uniref:helix-turn-helix transcriptional regulator n=1 Tax=Emticicia sp. BO119 TaxID=2757768 RepID=UPI0015F0256C|nr:WYL domain-containing protein [Emticicia sp. BO119]MBA4853302.1 WYL domain-containing protein [Emticicia sp. BO119]